MLITWTEVLSKIRTVKWPVLELGLRGGLLGSPKLLLRTASDEGSCLREKTAGSVTNCTHNFYVICQQLTAMLWTSTFWWTRNNTLALWPSRTCAPISRYCHMILVCGFHWTAGDITTSWCAQKRNLLILHLQRWYVLHYATTWTIWFGWCDGKQWGVVQTTGKLRPPHFQPAINWLSWIHKFSGYTERQWIKSD